MFLCVIQHSYFMRKDVGLPTKVGTFVNDISNAGTVLFMRISNFMDKKKNQLTYKSSSN